MTFATTFAPVAFIPSEAQLGIAQTLPCRTRKDEVYGESYGDGLGVQEELLDVLPPGLGVETPKVNSILLLAAGGVYFLLNFDETLE